MSQHSFKGGAKLHSTNSRNGVRPSVRQHSYIHVRRLSPYLSCDFNIFSHRDRPGMQLKSVDHLSYKFQKHVESMSVDTSRRALPRSSALFAWLSETETQRFWNHFCVSLLWLCLCSGARACWWIYGLFPCGHTLVIHTLSYLHFHT